MADTLLAARQYIHGPSVGYEVACEHAYERSGAFLAEQYEQGNIDGYNVVLARAPNDCLEELIDDDWKQLIPERYPMVYAFVQPLHTGDLLFEPFMVAEGLVFVK